MILITFPFYAYFRVWNICSQTTSRWWISERVRWRLHQGGRKDWWKASCFSVAILVVSPTFIKTHVVRNAQWDETKKKNTVVENEKQQVKERKEPDWERKGGTFFYSKWIKENANSVYIYLWDCKEVCSLSIKIL